MRSILLVDDEANVLSALVRAIKAHVPGEFSIETFTNPYEALKRCALHEFDLVISDFRMPEMTGVEFLGALKQIAPATVRMILSASTEFQTVSAAINEAEVFRYLAKPWLVDELKTNIEAALVVRDRLLSEQQRTMSPEEIERRKLEADEPGLTKVRWGPNGEIIL